MKKLLLALSLLCCTAVSAFAQATITLPIAANAVADIGNGPIKVRMIAGDASIFTAQSSGTGSTSGSSTALTLTTTPATPPLVGGLISGTGITSGTTVTAYNGTTGITLSAAMTVAGGTAVSWGAACPSTPPSNVIQASPMAGYFIMYTQARVCAVSPGGPVNTLLISPIFYDQTTPGGSGGPLTSAQIDAVCSTNNDFLIRLSGTWQCGATGTSGHKVPFLDGTNTWSGNQYFGSGVPWADVKSAANGCAAATGNGSTADQVAIQCQGDFLNTTFGGGILYFPPGNYRVTSTVTIKGNTFIQGAGNAISSLSINSNITALAFDSSVVYGGLDKFTVFGNQSTAATATLVTVANGIIVNFSNCELTGGNWALGNNGVDGNVSNCTIQGFGTSGGGVLSAGGNTYYNAKIDQTISASLAAFEQTVAYDGATKENRIISSDLSGSYTHALIVADTNNLAITTITNTAFSSAPISITGAATTMLNAVEIGATTLAAAGKIVITGSSGTAGQVTVSGGTQICAGNNSVLCNSTPSIASGACGATTNGTLRTGSTDQSGLVQIGSASTTTCTISLSGTLAAAPLSCVIFPANAAAAATGTTIAQVSSISASNWVITGSALANANYYYRCAG